MTKYLTFQNFNAALAVWISFVFLQSGFFKFSGAPESMYIFSTVGAWIGQTLHAGAGELMIKYGGVIIGLVEVVASVLLLMAVFNRLRSRPKPQDSQLTFWGAFLAFGVMSGAIFFHLFTPLGINVQNDSGTLFAMAVSVWVSSLVLMYVHRRSAW